MSDNGERLPPSNNDSGDRVAIVTTATVAHHNTATFTAPETMRSVTTDSAVLATPSKDASQPSTLPQHDLTPTANLKLLCEASTSRMCVSAGTASTPKRGGELPAPGHHRTMEEPFTPTANLNLLVDAASSLAPQDTTDRRAGLARTIGRARDRVNQTRAAALGKRGQKRARQADDEDDDYLATGSPQGDSEDEEGEGSYQRGGVIIGDCASVTSRKEKSLGLLCYKFIAKFEENPPSCSVNEVCLDAVAKELGVERRRIYDIVNVLESVEMMSRRAKNRYLWHGKTNLVYTLVKLKNLAVQEEVQEQLNLVRAYELSLKHTARLSAGKTSVPGDGLATIAPKSASDTPAPPTNELLTKFLEKFGSQIKKEKSLGIMSQKFLMLFLTDSRVINLDVAAKILIGDPTIESRNNNAKFKTKIRRLYDIANILSSLGLIKKCQVASDGRARKPAFEYIGPDFAREYKMSSHIDFNSSQQQLRAHTVAPDNSSHFPGLAVGTDGGLCPVARLQGPARAKRSLIKQASFDTMCKVASTERTRLARAATAPSLVGSAASSSGSFEQPKDRTVGDSLAPRQYMVIRDGAAEGTSGGHSMSVTVSRPEATVTAPVTTTPNAAVAVGENVNKRDNSSPQASKGAQSIEGDQSPEPVVQQVTLIPVGADTAALLQAGNQVVFRARLVEDKENVTQQGERTGTKRPLAALSDTGAADQESKRARTESLAAIGDGGDPKHSQGTHATASLGGATGLEVGGRQDLLLARDARVASELVPSPENGGGEVARITGKAQGLANGIARPMAIRRSPGNPRVLGSLASVINSGQLSPLSGSPAAGRTVAGLGMVTPSGVGPSVMPLVTETGPATFQLPMSPVTPAMHPHKQRTSPPSMGYTGMKVQSLGPASVTFMSTPACDTGSLATVSHVYLPAASPLAGSLTTTNSTLLPPEAFISPAPGGAAAFVAAGSGSTVFKTPSSDDLQRSGGQRRRVVYHTPGFVPYSATMGANSSSLMSPASLPPSPGVSPAPGALHRGNGCLPMLLQQRMGVATSVTPASPAAGGQASAAGRIHVRALSGIVGNGGLMGQPMARVGGKVTASLTRPAGAMSVEKSGGPTSTIRKLTLN